MCSPGGSIEDSEVATDLRYLRRERPTPTDLARIRHLSQADWTRQEEQRRRHYEEWQRWISAATGRVCGTVVRPTRKDDSDHRGAIDFLSTLGYSPVSPPYAQVKEDGSFCSENLWPGKYYLHFVRADDHGVEAVYFPGVTDVAKATPVEVHGGKTQSNILFKVPEQSAYSVWGFLFADQKHDFSGNVDSKDVTVLLIRSDGDRRLWFSEKATFFLPKTGYFKFEHIPPGHYIAYLSVPAQGWMTRKVEVDVTTQMKFISLDMVHSKAQKTFHH